MRPFATPPARLLPLLAVLLLAAPPASAQIERSDAVWARTSSAPIALDGVLDEEAWAQAEVITIIYGQRAGDPGSGFKHEGGLNPPPDPTRATVRFLVHDGQLYLGAEVEDNSIGGSREFNRKDGFLMSIMNGILPRLGGPGFSEYFYSWWYATLPAGEPIPDEPGFIGRYGNFDNPLSRTAEQIARWDARTVVRGTPNDDSGEPDEGYTVEMRFDLEELGYDLTQPVQIPFSISIYDVDGFFPFNDDTFSATRVWWQNAFNAPTQNYGRIFVDPAVTTTSGSVPAMPADFRIPNGASADAPTVDGRLDEAVWGQIEGVPIRFVADADDEVGAGVRRGYPGIGPFASGQFQPELDLNGDGANDPRAPVLDPGEATMKWFFRGNMLYVGVDVRDQAVVGGEPAEDRWDGFRLSLNDRAALEPNDNFLLPRTLVVRVGADGGPEIGEGLIALLDENPNAVQYGLHLKEGTVINDPTNVDAGYQIEMAIDLTALGYPANRGDGVLYVGAALFDYDTFDDPLAGYGTRAWLFRERGGASAALAYMDPAFSVSSDGGPGTPSGFRLLGAYPNPSRGTTTLELELPGPDRVSVTVYDVLGREVARADLGARGAGLDAVALPTEGLPAGLYLYRVHLEASGATAAGRLTLVR
jgi:hypothetical protein